MVYDAARERCVMFGDEAPVASQSNATWEWDGDSWSSRLPATRPPARTAHALAYDAARRRVVLFGGQAGGSLADTWEWDGDAWSLRTPGASPPLRSGRSKKSVPGRFRASTTNVRCAAAVAEHRLTRKKTTLESMVTPT